MSYITFNPNEVVYIRGIGYATLVTCGQKKTITQRVQIPYVKKQSIYFDPDLFNSEIDSNNEKKSHSKSDQQKPQIKLPTEIQRVNNVNQSNINAQTIQNRQNNSHVNIVQATLSGSKALIYTSQKNISKTIFIVIRSLLPNHKEQIIVQIEISKTIDALRKAIFQQIGEQVGSYYNIKLFATNPLLSELGVHSKTIYQCLIKDNDKLILTADYTFGFRPLPSNINCKSKITLNSNILISTIKLLEEPKVPIAPPPQGGEQLKIEPQKYVSVDLKVQQIKLSVIDLPAQRKVVENQTYNALCNIQLASGRRYWEIKVQKTPTDEGDLMIGVCAPSNNMKLRGSIEGCNYIWGYYAISGKKVYEKYDEEGNILEDQNQQYGYAVRPNDIIGVLTTIKGKSASIHFYKNSISCGEAFQIDLAQLSNIILVPFVNIGGEAQVTLDSKAQLPLDSFRNK